MDEHELSKAMSLKGEKRRSFSMVFKADAAKYAKENSINAAALKFKVDRKRVREWISQIDRIKEKSSKRQRLDGGGRKVMNEDIEEQLLNWVLERRSRMLHVSRKMIKMKAKSMFDSTTQDPAVQDSFVASKGWLENFMSRNGLSTRRRTTAQKDPAHMIEKFVSYVMHVRRLKKQYIFSSDCIIAMDETPVWSDMVSATTVDKTGARDVPLKSTGHEKVRVAVCLAAKANGVKLKPFIVFAGAKREVKALHEEFKNQCSVASSPNAWMNTELTKQRVNEIIGRFTFQKKLLAWDSFEAHLTDDVKRCLAQAQCEQAIVPGGCTKYIQAPDVVWNKPFKN